MTGTAGRGIADWLSLGAAPCFAAMALQTSLAGNDHAPLHGGMLPMYLLMALFHLAPWFNLKAARTSRA